MERNFENVLVEQCAPTLAGIKPANLFRFLSQDRADTLSRAGRWAARLEKFGLRLCVLKECVRSEAFLIYVYRERELAEILEREEVARFLSLFGYEGGGVETALLRLSGRLCMEADFPHEMGVFLGYPLEDVVGFIENRGRNYTYSGYWKSYGDPERARALCESYKSCTAAYLRRYIGGTPIQKLIVA